MTVTRRRVVAPLWVIVTAIWFGIYLAIVPNGWWDYIGVPLFALTIVYLGFARETVYKPSPPPKITTESMLADARSQLPTDLHEWFDTLSESVELYTRDFPTEDLIPVGTYDFEIVGKPHSGYTKKNKTPYFGFMAKVMRGPDAGTVIPVNVYMSIRTAGAYAFYRRQLRDLGIEPGLPPAEAVRHLPKVFSGALKHEGYAGITRQQIHIRPFRGQEVHGKHCACCTVAK